MFVSQAHSFKQQARLAVTLAWVAGYTNIVAVLACGTVISHASGTASNFGNLLALGDWRVAAYAFFLLVTFFIGAAISGFFTELGRRRGWESIYVLPMIAEAALLAVFATGIELYGSTRGGFTFLWITGAASMAMGLQNATITRISNGVVRTTHVTGVITDLGLGVVQMLFWAVDKRRDFLDGLPRSIIHSAYTHPTSRRLAVLGSIILTFILGSALGHVAYAHIPRWAMFPPVAFLLWIVFQDVTRPIAEIEASDMIAANHLPLAIAVYHLKRSHNRKDSHRMPNLLAWSERLPDTARVVILDLGAVAEIDSNVVMELRALRETLDAQDRHLVIAGVNTDQFEPIRGAGAGDLLESSDICPDLELAVARGLNLLEPAGLRQ